MIPSNCWLKPAITVAAMYCTIKEYPTPAGGRISVKKETNVAPSPKANDAMYSETAIGGMTKIKKLNLIDRNIAKKLKP